MTINRKIIFLFVCFGLFLSCLATGYVAHREYQTALDSLVGEAKARLQQNISLQFYLYQRNELGLQRILAQSMESQAVSGAGAYSSLGELLATSGRTADLPSLDSIRADVSVTDTSLTAYDQNRKSSRTSFWQSLLTRGSTIYLVTPIFSHINPTAQDLNLTDFTEAQSSTKASKSLVVIGFVCLVIDQDILLQALHPAIYRFVITSLILILLCATLVYRILRGSTAPLTKLMRLSNQILAGDNVQKLDTAEAGEFINIVTVFNSAIDGAASFKDDVGLEHKLLRLKADERASLLSVREQELSKATEEVSATREQLHRLENYDRLTSLPNRYLFAEQLSVLLRLCARNARPLAVLFINLNNFHRINESLGRSTGDLILQAVGKRLIECLRNSDMLAHHVSSDEELNISRLGGDEFAAVISELHNIDEAGMVAQRVTDRLIEPMVIDGHELVVTPSIGISVAPRHSMEVEELLNFAGTAMHHAKAARDITYLYYQEDMKASGQDDLKMESELRKAIERSELSLHYQPQVNTTDGSIISAEALLRWEHPDYGMVSPAKFIGLAERVGLIWELGDWALVEACRQMSEFKAQGLQLPRVTINISPHQFKPEFVERVKAVLESSGLSPSALELGLSNAITRDIDNSVYKFLNELKTIGVYLSLENFGTNQAPIGFLGRHPLDELKIDRSFIADCDTRKDGARMVKAIIAMAKSLGLRTAAEGVETEGECRFLVDNGVSIMRGYLFSRPVPAAELRELLVVPWHYMGQLHRMALKAELVSSSDF
jgi:diguanylate cyclase (GGDEF)-like protein